MFCSNPVNLPRFAHELTESIHSKTNVWSGVRQIHQGPNQLVIQVGSIKFESEAESLSFFKFASIGVAMDLQSNILNLFSIYGVFSLS